MRRSIEALTQAQQDRVECDTVRVMPRGETQSGMFAGFRATDRLQDALWDRNIFATVHCVDPEGRLVLLTNNAGYARKAEALAKRHGYKMCSVFASAADYEAWLAKPGKRRKNVEGGTR